MAHFAKVKNGTKKVNTDIVLKTFVAIRRMDLTSLL